MLIVLFRSLNLLIVFLCVSVARPSHHGNACGFNRTVLSELEHLSELYYEDQKDERFYKISDDFNRMKPNFACVHGVTPLGNAGQDSITDGHKFACGILHIEYAPIVYSFGSHQQQDFEESVLKLRPDAKIFVFELMPEQLPKESIRDPRIEYNGIGLGGYTRDSDGKVIKDTGMERFTFKTMKEMMLERNHTYVDVVKMDIEGTELTWLRQEAPILIPRIGQLLVELHFRFGESQRMYPKDDAFTFVTEVEKYGFRLFHQEVNKHQTIRFTELSLMHKNWTKWNSHKVSFKPL